MFGPFKNYLRFERINWMAKNPWREVKRFETVEISSISIERTLTPPNINVECRCNGIWLVNNDALTNDEACSQVFEIPGDNDAKVVINMLILPQGCYHLLGDDDEHGNAT